MYIGPYHLPRLSTPFAPEAINPYYAEAQRQTLDWVRYYDLIKTNAAFKKFEAGQFWNLAALAYPTASRQQLQLISNWMAWLFIQDDHFDEARVGRQSRRLQHYVEAALSLLRQPRMATPRDDGALLAGLSDLWGRMREMMPPDLAARFIMSFETYTTGCLWELENRAFSYTPTENEYIAVRRDTSGFRPCALLIEMCLPEALPALVREHPVMRKMQDMTNDVLSWTNDLFSFEKESKRGDTHNLVILLCKHQNLTLQTAVDVVGQRIETAIDQFKELETALPALNPEGDALVKSYLSGLKAWMNANLAWSLATGRYVAQPAQDDTSAIETNAYDTRAG